MKQKPITIIGGGLAGLTLGIGLRQRDVPVTILEAGHYPRHRVCGEFISGRGLDVLSELGILQQFQNAGAIIARTAAFFFAEKTSGIQRLPQPALCLSRFEMDALLARKFRDMGGELREGERWTAKNSKEGIVRASGRTIEKSENGWRLFGLKVHAKNVQLEADLEMHLGKKGYVGLCKLPGGEANICGLFWSRTAVPELAKNWRAWLIGEKSHLAKRLSAADLDESSFCAVAGISLRPRRAAGRNECAIGDALSMIPPMTGNGMSMAFESAQAAILPLADYAAGRGTWEMAEKKIAQKCDNLFKSRLVWAAGLQKILMKPRLHRVLMAGMRQWPALWTCCFGKTR